MTRRLLIAGTLFGVLLGPAITLMVLATVMNPAAQASCLTTTPFPVGAVPDRLAATTSDGIAVTLTRQQLTHAATIVGVGGQFPGVESPRVSWRLDYLEPAPVGTAVSG